MSVETTTDDFASLADGATLLIQRWLPGPVERIWDYLIESELRRKWLAAGEMVPTVGAGFELVWLNDELSDATDPRPAGFPEEQRMQSRIIAIEPMRGLSFAWGKGDVTIALEPRGDRVLLTLTHRGLDASPDPAPEAAGWHMHLDILRALAEGRKPASFWSGWRKLRGLYRTRLAD